MENVAITDCLKERCGNDVQHKKRTRKENKTRILSRRLRPLGSRVNCATCPYITNRLTSYTFYATGETRSITSHITCNTKNVIYMVQCNRCNLQYIGETKRRLKDRFNEHRRAVDKTNIKSKPTTVSEHFLSHSNHSHTDMQLIPLEKIHSSRDSVRKI